MIYSVNISLRRDVSLELMDHDDKENDLLIDGFHQLFIIRCANSTEAATNALDAFHATHAIANLDDFTIETTVTPMSGHDQIKKEIDLGTLTLLAYDPLPLGF